MLPQAEAIRARLGILDTLNRMLPLEHSEEAGSPLSGSEVDIVSYAGDTDLIAKTVGAVTDCIRAGFKRSHIAVISYRDREHSKLAPYDSLIKNPGVWLQSLPSTHHRSIESLAKVGVHVCYCERRGASSR